MNNLNNDLILTELPKTISGIDTLYYFYETNSYYDELFLEIIDQIEDKKQKLERNRTIYKYSDIPVTINDQVFSYSGKDQGYYWLSHIDSLFRIGFKSTFTNKKLHDIQVQLDSRGIYTFGIKAIVKLIDNLLDGFITGLKPITRADLNIFVQDDLSWITKDMFVTRKRVFQTISKEIASKHGMQTLYIGKKPFLLRIYNKTIELQGSKKHALMWEHFINNDFDVKKTVFNIEFEMHRDYLVRNYGIHTIDHLFERSVDLFKECMDAIRLVDLTTITENERSSNNKNRAESLALWTHLKDSYTLDSFLQLDLGLQRLKRKISSYSEMEAVKDYIAFKRRCDINGVFLDAQFYEEVEKKSNSINKRADRFNYKLVYGQFLTAYRFPDIESMSDEELVKHFRHIEIEMDEPFKEYDRAFEHLQAIRDELENRGISEKIEF